MKRKKVAFILILFLLSITLAIKVAAQDAYQLFDRGVALFDAGDMTEALEAFKQAAVEKKNFVEAYFNIGIINDLQGNYKEAIDAYKKVLEIDSSSIEEIYENLAIDSYRIGNLTDTLIYAKMAERQGMPLNEKLKNILSQYHVKGSDMALTPLSMFDSGQLESIKKEIQEDIKRLEYVIEKKGKSTAKEMLDLAVKYRQIEKIDKALEILNKSVAQYGEAPAVLAELSLCHFLNGDIKLFMEYFKKAQRRGYRPSSSLSDLYLQTLTTK